jgi:hypothetical protein
MSDKVITDWVGRPLGVIKTDGTKSTVTDWVGRPLGSADDKGTRDFIGKPISPQNVPGILIKRGT